MSSRAEQKAQARAERLRLQQQEAAAATRQRRLYRLGGVIATAIVVVIIAIAVSSSSNKPSKPQPSAAAATTVNQLLAGIPQAGNRLGRATAPVTVTEYGDLECPICRDFALGSEDRLIENDVRSGRVKLIYRSLETATADPGTFQMQQVAALAAGEQQRLWHYVELFYHEQGAEDSGYVTETYLDGLARQVAGLNQQAWTAARNAKSLAAQVTADTKQAAAAGFTSTPTIVVQGPKGTAQPIVGVPDYPSLEQAIQQIA